jgi:hypothetical protein
VTDLRLANLEEGLVAYLNGLLAPAVSTRVPNPRPVSFVRVGRVGGDQINMAQERAVVLVECWAATAPAAWALAREAHGLLAGREPLEIPGAELSSRSLSSPVNYPDPATTSPRYQFTMTAAVDLVKEITP